MTALRRRAPLLAPRVSSSAVGNTSVVAKSGAFNRGRFLRWATPSCDSKPSPGNKTACDNTLDVGQADHQSRVPAFGRARAVVAAIRAVVVRAVPASHALRTRLDSWAGIGHVAVGMAHQCYDLQLTRYDERGWRATFYTTGMEHSPTSATGTGWERTPWHATQGRRGRRCEKAAAIG